MKITVKKCPRPCNNHRGELTVQECVKLGECGCGEGPNPDAAREALGSVKYMDVIIDGEIQRRPIDHLHVDLNEIDMIDLQHRQRRDSGPKAVPVLYKGEELLEVISGPPVIVKNRYG